MQSFAGGRRPCRRKGVPSPVPAPLQPPPASVTLAAGALLSAALLSAGCASPPEAYTPGEMSQEQFAACKAVAQAYYDRDANYESLRDALRSDALASKWFVRYLVHDVVRMREGQSVLLSEEKVRYEAIGDLGATPAQFDLPGQRDDLRAIGEILAMGSPAVEVVVEDLLKDRQAFLRTIAVEVLAAFGDRAVPALLKVASSGDVREQGYAARALGAIGARGAALDALRTLTRSTEWRVRSAAAQALALGGSGARALLVDMLNDPDAFVKRKSAESLGSHRDPDAVDALVAFLEVSKARDQWSGELAAQQALQKIAGSSGPRTAERWRRFAEDFRSERQ